MKKMVFDTYDQLGAYAAQFVAQQVKKNPHTVLGLPTGGTPLSMYSHIAALYREGKVDFSDVVTFNLDEYLGLGPEHEQSYYYFMNQNLYSKVNLKKENIHIPSGVAPDMEQECRDYDEKIKAAGGIDLMVLGIGPNGHIGFNEPDGELQAATHLVDLTQETIQANARFFSDISQVPVKAITMGVGTILNAKRILMLISGENKQKIARELFEGNITTQNPSSLLRVHPDVTVLLDKAAAGGGQPECSEEAAV